MEDRSMAVKVSNRITARPRLRLIAGGKAPQKAKRLSEEERIIRERLKQGLEELLRLKREGRCTSCGQKLAEGSI
jgi:hypothetical protein